MSSEDAAGGARNEQIQTLVKGFAVIKAFGSDHPKLTLAEVSRATGLTRAGARRILLTLKALGYVSSDDRYFRLEPRVLELGYSYLSAQAWWRPAQSVVQKLAEQIDHPVAVGVIDHDAVTYLAHARPQRFEAFARSVGTRLPIGTSAIGRVLLSELSAEQINERLTGATMLKLTKATIIDPNQLRSAIVETRNLGYSLIVSELEIGLRSLAVPIRDRVSNIVAAIGMSSTEPEIDNNAFVGKYLANLHSAADEIAAGLPH